MRRVLELKQMAAHEAKMQQPVKVLFPRETRGRYMSCKHCGGEFFWSYRAGTIPLFCNDRCRDAHSR